MKVRDLMAPKPEYLGASTTISQAAQKMRDLDCGFLPISDRDDEKLIGVVTDRDITIRGVAEDLPPSETPVKQIASEKVLYCFQDDDIETAAESMRDQQVYRLVVLENETSKKLVGVVTLGDYIRENKDAVASDTVKEIMKSA